MPFKTGCTRCDLENLNQRIADPGKQDAACKQQYEKRKTRARKLSQHDKGLVTGGGNHAPHDRAKADHAVHIKAHIHKSAQATRRGAQEGGQGILPPGSAFNDFRHAPLAGGIDKIHQQHHNEHEKGDYRCMLENSD